MCRKLISSVDYLGFDIFLHLGSQNILLLYFLSLKINMLIHIISNFWKPLEELSHSWNKRMDKLNFFSPNNPHCIPPAKTKLPLIDKKCLSSFLVDLFL